MTMLTSTRTQIGGIRKKFPVWLFNENTKDFFQKFDDIHLAAEHLKTSPDILRQALRKKKPWGGYYLSKTEYLNQIDTKLF